MTDTALASAARIAALAEAAGAVAGSLDLEETLRAIVVAGRAVTGARYAALGVLGPDRRIARFITSGMDAETVPAPGRSPRATGSWEPSSTMRAHFGWATSAPIPARSGFRSITRP